MNRIERMVAEMCPDGVAWKPLGEVVQLVTGGTPNKHVPEYWEDGTIPWMSSGEVNKKHVYSTDGFITELGLLKSNAKMVSPRSVVIALAGQGKTRGKVATVEIELSTNQSLCTLVPGREISYRFLYHFLDGQYEKLRSISSGEGARGGLSLAILKSFVVPVPPIEIQREIVDILDSFTRLEAELEAELEARKAQYAFYRDRLLNFDFAAGGGASLGGLRAFEVSWALMGEVFEMDRGHGMPKELFVSEGIPAIHYGHIHMRYGVSTRKSEVYVAEDCDSSLIRVNPGDVVMAATSENLEDVGKATVWLGDRPAVTGGHTTVLRSENDGRFISHYLRSAEFQRMKRRAARGTKVIELSGEPLSKIKVPIPPIEVQREIADVLDDFDALVNDLSSGLPAEIAARRQQYEYYRDRLLTFPEKK